MSGKFKDDPSDVASSMSSNVSKGSSVCSNLSSALLVGEIHASFSLVESEKTGNNSTNHQKNMHLAYKPVPDDYLRWKLYPSKGSYYKSYHVVAKGKNRSPKNIGLVHSKYWLFFGDVPSTSSYKILQWARKF